MDRIDRKILDYLQQDASISNVDLADRVGLAPSSCLRRVRNLWKEGIITRSIVLTDGEKLGRNVKAIVSVKLFDHGNAAREEWLQALAQERSVSQVYSVSGETDAVVFLTLSNMKEFQELSQSLFAGNSNVFQFVTQFILEEHKFELAN
jgi:DNA-binding Lrp family transcriptional regulator